MFHLAECVRDSINLVVFAAERGYRVSDCLKVWKNFISGEAERAHSSCRFYKLREPKRRYVGEPLNLGNQVFRLVLGALCVSDESVEGLLLVLKQRVKRNCCILQLRVESKDSCLKVAKQHANCLADLRCELLHKSELDLRSKVSKNSACLIGKVLHVANWLL